MGYKLEAVYQQVLARLPDGEVSALQIGDEFGMVAGVTNSKTIADHIERMLRLKLIETKGENTYVKKQPCAC